MPNVIQKTVAAVRDFIKPPPGVPRRAMRFALGNASDQQSLGRKWSANSAPARTFISRNQREQVGRSRDVCMNNDYARQFLRMFVQNVIGEDGIKFQGSVRKRDGTLDADINEILQEAWMEWNDEMNCSLSEDESFIDIQQAAATSLCTDGEFFVRVFEDDSKFGMKLQMLDAQRCSPLETRKFQYAHDEALYNGILFDRPTMKPIAYLFGGEHTNDNYYDDSSDRYDRIGAHEILHGFLKERIGQHRGLPVIHSALNRTFSLDKYEESALQAAQVGAGAAGFFEVDVDGVGATEEATENEEMVIDPRHFNELPTGWKLTTYDPNYPTRTVRGFCKVWAEGYGIGDGRVVSRFVE